MSNFSRPTAADLLDANGIQNYVINNITTSEGPLRTTASLRGDLQQSVTYQPVSEVLQGAFVERSKDDVLGIVNYGLSQSLANLNNTPVPAFGRFFSNPTVELAQGTSSSGGGTGFGYTPTGEADAGTGNWDEVGIPGFSSFTPPSGFGGNDDGSGDPMYTYGLPYVDYYESSRTKERWPVPNYPDGQPQMRGEDVARAFHQYGEFTGTDLIIAVAIAERETHWYPHTIVRRYVSRDFSFGLMGMNMRGELGPDRRKAYGLQSNNELLDARVTAKATRNLYESGKKYHNDGWHHWGGYKGVSVPQPGSNRYKRAEEAVNNYFKELNAIAQAGLPTRNETGVGNTNSGGGNNGPSRTSTTTAVNRSATAMIQKGLTVLGRPYTDPETEQNRNSQARKLIESPVGFDCSGFIYWAASKTGYKPPGDWMTKISSIYWYQSQVMIKLMQAYKTTVFDTKASSNLMTLEEAASIAGLLIAKYKRGSYGHIGISLGNGTVLEATSASGYLLDGSKRTGGAVVLNDIRKRGTWDVFGYLPGMTFGTSAVPGLPTWDGKTASGGGWISGKTFYAYNSYGHS